MSRYVDADKVCEITIAHKDFGQCIADLVSLKEVLHDTPTVDVAPMKHGQWIKYAKYSFGTMYDCSIYSTRIIDDGHSWHYCPNCGAKMDIERKEEE